MSLTALAIIAGLSALSSAHFSAKAGIRQEKQLGLQQQQLNESMRSNYYSYMQQLNAMQGEYAQDQLAINQQRENIASNMNYMDRWASEYDLSMQNNIDEAYSQYQSLASNYASGLVSNAETGRRGGSAGMLAQDAGIGLKAINGSTEGFSLSGRLGSFLQSSALDMLADRQTAISSIGTGYKAIGSYQEAMNSLQGSIGSMTATTDQMKNELKNKGMIVE